MILRRKRKLPEDFQNDLVTKFLLAKEVYVEGKRKSIESLTIVISRLKEKIEELSKELQEKSDTLFNVMESKVKNERELEMVLKWKPPF